MNRIFSFCLLLMFLASCLISTSVYSLKRDDYYYSLVDDYTYEDCCRKHFISLNQNPDSMVFINKDVIPLLPLFPFINKNCCALDCYSLSIYKGYFDTCLSRYSGHLKSYLDYCVCYPECQCFWPEISSIAGQINDLAYDLFENLISSTPLNRLDENGFCDCGHFTIYAEHADDYEEDECDCSNQLERFLAQPPTLGLFTKTSVIAGFVSHSFFFSDYLNICQDLSDYCRRNYNEKTCLIIEDKLDNILEQLAPLYLKLHQECRLLHPNERIEKENFILKSVCSLDPLDLYNSKEEKGFEGKILASSVYSNHFNIVEGWIFEDNTRQMSMNEIFATQDNRGDYHNPSKLNLDSNIYLEKGAILNDLLLYKEAIQLLTESIRLNPSNREAYIERAMAYFETDQLPLALKDYQKAKKLTVIPPPFKSTHFRSMMATIDMPEDTIEFSMGLVPGVIKGAKVSAKEFIPSTLSCCRGLLNGLWAFVLSPAEVSLEMRDTAYAIGRYISSHSTAECLKCVVPELRDLALTWEKIDDYTRGEKIGYIIGKYGLDIFIPLGLIKGAKKFRALKRANTMCTLEACTISQAKKVKILEESIKRATTREVVIAESLKKGKILIKSSNVQNHVMQPKHAWDKVIKLSGNVEGDFKKVVLLLEENGILAENYLIESQKFAQGAIIRSDYKMLINGNGVRAIFETYVETNQTFLKDAWVITK